MGRFPFGIANSWYQVLYSDELAIGEVVPLKYFGKDLVAFRGEDGQAHVLDAYCAHLGAHLGVGGTVVGNAIRCPFHAWEYDGAGRCVGIPYAKKVPAKARVPAYEIREHSGVIFVWYHAEGKPPDFEIPAVAEWGAEDWTTEWTKYSWEVKTHPQEIMENAIDWSHFNTVHGMEMPEDRIHRFDGKLFVWGLGTTKTVSTLDVQDTLNMEAQNWGLGWAYLRYDGMFSTVICSGLTPIDEETTNIKFAVIGKHDGRSPDEMKQLLKAYSDDQAVAIQQDFEIWEAKKFRARPNLCDGDGPIGEYRRWARQFYSVDWYEEATRGD